VVTNCKQTYFVISPLFCIVYIIITTSCILWYIIYCKFYYTGCPKKTYTHTESIKQKSFNTPNYYMSGTYSISRTSAAVPNDHRQLRGTVYSDEQLRSGRQSCFARPISSRGFRSVADFHQNIAPSKTLHKKSHALTSDGSRRYSNRSCTPPPSIGKTVSRHALIRRW
jgi:hypothetical protein